MAFVRGIRGAITVERNNSEEIGAATKELLQTIAERNQLDLEDVVSVFFTVTEDLTASYPAKAAREIGWHNVPLFSALEPPIEGALPRCIRILVHVNTGKSQQEIKHVFLREAACLRPDLAG
ncbi:chorismate mutase [Desulforamulus ferrireducens]|uniref:chorismate mutase n=1 Tax=Desulforamulus ferrireducens TaxID=1833852 RepID=A0A1S6IUY5_9FIRM|nr:chorismate mutase [Desulforamulus ferrireducens]AQS58586.1 chorismate mutase [Desulforamulus ferrireducens]